MDKFFIAIAFIAAIGVVISLFAGLSAMSRGTDKARQTSQRMMQARVILQGVALTALLLAYWTKH